MKTFDDIKNYFAILGIKSRESTRKHLLNVTIVFIFLIHGMEVSLSSAYAFRIAIDFAEYVDCFYRITSLIACTIFFATIVWNMPKLYKFICDLENTIGKSE